MSNDPWGKPPPNDQWGGNQWGQQQPPNDQWGQQQPPNDQWGGNQWGQQQPPNDQWGNNQWGQQQPNQWNQQQSPMGQMPPYMRAERSSCCLTWVLGSGFLMTLLCIGCSAGIFFFAKGFLNLTPPVATFMEAGQNNDVNAAMAVLSTTPDLTRSDIATLFEDRELFEDYKDINFPNEMNAQEIKMENMRVNATGTINYTTGEDGRYHATLIKQNGQWRIENISIIR